MELFEAIGRRHSCRDLTPGDVPQQDLEKILDAGRRAASGMNVQPFQFLVVSEREGIEKIATAQGFISGASVVIMIVADPEASKYWLEDISAAAENMLLAITALGYGSTWVEGTLLRKEDEVKKYFGIPANRRLMIALPIGKPASRGAQAEKKPLADLVRCEKW
ncbi:MAG: nitroreductase family protein [Planctomycetia bacterium]|nr:nitroreductase family protein [Planctomycetia bacterium]